MIQERASIQDTAGAAVPIHIVLNWFEELEQLAPPK